jgi:hypothetical protein
MPEGSAFSVKDLGEVIAKALGLKPGENIEIQRDRLNPNRVMVLRIPDEQGSTA